MRKGILAALAMCTLLAVPARAATDSFIAVVTILTTDGDVTHSEIASTAKGVSLTECELRREAWLKEFGARFDATVASMEKDGKYPAYRVTCEPKR